MTEEIRAEIEAAVSKTGWTDNLRRAVERIPVLLSMKPETVEAYLKTLEAQ